MCVEGLWTFWRHWKPEIFDVVSDGWEPLRFCLFVSHNVYNGEPIEIEAVLANEGILKSGEYTANLAILGEQGIVYSERADFSLDEDELAVPIVSKRLDVDLPKGKYKLLAELPDAAARGAELQFFVCDKNDNHMGGVSLAVVGLDAKTKRYLEKNGATVTQWDGGKCDLLLVGDADADTVDRDIDIAEGGTTVLFLAKEIWLDEQNRAIDVARRVVKDFSIKRYTRWLYHPECVLADRDVFAGVGRGLALLRDFGPVFPS